MTESEQLTQNTIRHLENEIHFQRKARPRMVCGNQITHKSVVERPRSVVKASFLTLHSFFVSQRFAVGADLNFFLLAIGLNFGFVGYQLVELGEGFDFENLACACFGLESVFHD